ncbi:aarF domain-containing kinase 1 isoform X1 [Halyomorpha halys]|uniref:aarF domain-containing kinase 1 isoform X1 n=1 Tax=Halyomorpha halys TaxID=286706 RepID=UPI0006D4EECF|nr:uncharacterized aarF domain-containing protein kinase 1 isoform X1 [Halyomorpha halys]
MWTTRQILKYTIIGGGLVGTAISYKANMYNFEAIGLFRFGRAAATALAIGLHYRKQLYLTDLDPQSLDYFNLRSKTHKEAAVKLLELCCMNKGVFIKVGQHIGSLEYLLPIEYVETMKILHSHAPQSPLKDIYSVIKEDLHKDPSELFIEFDTEPIGTASLAQVHRAKLKDGRVVAVKVQHPFVRGNSIVDMKTMEVLINIMAWVFPEFKFKWLVEESKKNIPRELDFTEEAKNTIKVKKMFQHFSWLKIPDILSELSTKRVLTMEYVDGGQVNDVNYMKENKINPFDVSDKLGLLYSEMIFRNGFVHSDPHPGNILVKKEEDGKTYIVLLDHGLYANISDKVRTEYSGLWLSILDKDMKGMKKHGEALGVGSLYDLFACMVAGRSWTAIQSGITQSKHTVQEKEQFQHDIPLVLAKITETLHYVNREMLLILKTNDLLRGIEYTLHTDNRMSSFLVMSKSCVRCVYEQKLKHCSTKLDKMKISIIETWELLKISIYYTYLSLKTFSWRQLLML